MIVKTEEKDMVRDIKTMSLSNTNKTALQRHQEEIKKANKMANLEKDVDEMKKMLALILEKINGN